MKQLLLTEIFIYYCSYFIFSITVSFRAVRIFRSFLVIIQFLDLHSIILCPIYLSFHIISFLSFLSSEHSCYRRNILTDDHRCFNRTISQRLVEGLCPLFLEFVRLVSDKSRLNENIN